MTLIALMLSIAGAAGFILAASAFIWPRRGESVERVARIGFLRRILDRAGLARVTQLQFVGLSLACGFMVGGITVTILPVTTLGVCAGLVACATPTFLLVQAGSRRQRLRDSLWPEAIDLMISGIRAGASVVTAVTSLGRVMPESIASAARRFEAACARSGNVDECLVALKHDWADASGDRLVELLRVTHYLGGNRLTLVLREFVRGMREEIAIRREIEARQSWVRVAAGIGVSAPWIVVAIIATRQEAAATYQSVQGTTLIVGGLALTGLAYVVMTRIGRLPRRRRWFA